MPRYLVEFFGEVEIEAEDETQAEVEALENHADSHVMARALVETEEVECDIPY